MARCLSGEAKAWDELVLEHGPGLQRRLRLIANRRDWRLSPADIEDIVSKVWEDLLRDDCRLLRIFRPEASLEAFLASVAVDRLLPFVRSRIRKDRHIEAFASILRDGGFSPRSQGDPAESMERQERILRAIRQLPVREQFSVEAFYWGGWSYRQIARVLEIPVHHVGPLLRSARLRLKPFMEKPSGLSL